MNPEAEMVAAMEIVVASQFPHAVPLMHQSAIVHEVLCNSGTDVGSEQRIAMMRTLANLSILSGMTLPQTAFAWLSHSEGIEGFMSDHGITHNLLMEADQKLALSLSALQQSVIAINDEANNLQSMLFDIYRASE